MMDNDTLKGQIKILKIYSEICTTNDCCTSYKAVSKHWPLLQMSGADVNHNMKLKEMINKIPI